MKRIRNEYIGKSIMLYLTEEETMEANRMVREMHEYMMSSMSPEDRLTYNNKRRKRVREKIKRRQNPVLCETCQIYEFCQKRKRYNLVKCSNGIRK